MKELNVYKIKYLDMKEEYKEIFVIAENEEDAKDMFSVNFWYDDDVMALAYKKFVGIIKVASPMKGELENAKMWTISFGYFGAESEKYYNEMKK